MSHFDWYSGSYDGTHDRLVAAIHDGFGPRLVGRREKGKNGFENALRLRAERGFHAVVMWGGRLHRGRVHAAFTGWCAHPGSELFRRVEPQHTVSRCDVAEDFAGPEAMPRLCELSERVARTHRVARSRIVSDDPAAGMTVNVGSRASAVSARIYEKGKKAIAGGEIVDDEALPVELHGHPLDTWVRLEVEIKPGKQESRAAVARMQPEELWGCSDWSADLYRQISGSSVERVRVGSVWKADDMERTTRALLTQYGRHLERMVADLGSWDCVGLQLRDELAKLRKTRG